LKLTIKFQREGTRAKPVYADYEVDIPEETTVYDALVSIRETQDGTMAFRGNCGVGFCGDCTVSINGGQKPSCLVTVGNVQKENVITIQPVRYAPVTKHVMYDADKFIWDKLTPFARGLVPNGDRPVSDKELEPVRKAMRCTTCGLCDEGCSVIDVNLDFYGPAALMKLYRFAFDPRDSITAERLTQGSETNGIWDCVHCWEATEHCPFGLEPTHLIMETRDHAVSYGVRSGHGNKSAERHYDSFARSVERSGWLDERAVALASYGGLVKGGIKLLPMALKALKRGKATLKPHHKRPGAGEIKKIFERYRRSTADRRKES
jgi:succinate dehydrogenase / fumarate reductase iron-sulfur subunit